MNAREANISMIPIELFGVEADPTKYVRGLWIILDYNITFHCHISMVCSSRFHHNRDLQCIRCHLDLDNAKLLAHALVSSHLDYCNSLLSDIADTDLTKFQRVQNRLPHVVMKSPFPCSAQLLHSLYWLQVKFRVTDLKKTLAKKPNLIICSPCLPHNSHPVYWDFTRESLYWFPGFRPMVMQGHFSLVP